MKALLFLVLLIGVGVFLVYNYGGYKTFDPSQQGRDALAAIEPGMSWEEVVEAAGAPNKYRPIQKVVEKSGPNTFETFKDGPQITFKDDALRSRVEEGSLEHGFVFEYRFSQSVAFKAIFDGSGTLTGTEDMATMADLLDRP